MSSTYCEHCDNRISDGKAKKCPNCGSPLRKKSNSGQDKVAFIGFVLVIIIVLVSLTGRISEFTDKKTQRKEQSEQQKIIAQMPGESHLADKVAAARQDEKQSTDFTDEIEINYLKLERVRPEKETEVGPREVELSDPKGEDQYKKEVAKKKRMEIAELEKKVRTLPASRVSENLNIYNQLLALDPHNQRYRKKVAFYKTKLKEHKSKQVRKGEFVMIGKAVSAPVLSYPLKGSLLGSIPAGKKVQILEIQVAEKGISDQTWYRVRFGGSHGWISNNVTTAQINNESVISERSQKKLAAPPSSQAE